MAMRVPNGTMRNIIMYKINCTAYVYIVYFFLDFQGTYFQFTIMSVLYTFIAVLTNRCCTVEIKILLLLLTLDDQHNESLHSSALV